MALQRRWCRVAVVRRDGTLLVECMLAGSGDPDLDAVDAVAHLALFAKRHDCVITIDDVAPALRELLELTGLRVEMQRKTELGEQPFGFEERQEETHLGDLPA